MKSRDPFLSFPVFTFRIPMRLLHILTFKIWGHRNLSVCLTRLIKIADRLCIWKIIYQEMLESLPVIQCHSTLPRRYLLPIDCI
jgi:hypothetical protein